MREGMAKNILNAEKSRSSSIGFKYVSVNL
jgi:hypothetical protein